MPDFLEIFEFHNDKILVTNFVKSYENSVIHRPL